MYKGKNKKFRDTIHGYIEIPEPIVTNIIDTELFQRLRYIEQTSMRPLYPAARHDRFIHSLGVYWIGKQAFTHFKENAVKVLKNESETPDIIWWEKQEILFSLACLLHDCAHAPFSHTLESLYTLRKIKWDDKNISELDYRLLGICTEKDKCFETDFFMGTEKSFECKGVGAPHEKMSAYCVVNEFSDAIKAVAEKIAEGKIEIDDTDIIFVVRMIIGCNYGQTDIEYNSLKNCIIAMLNSSSIDVDGLDYIVRDAYMSGIDNYSIDYQRLLSSFTIIPVDVFRDCEIKDLDITGIWLKESKFSIRNYKSNLLEGKMTFEGLQDEDRVEILNDKIQRTAELMNTKADSRIAVDIGKSQLLLKEACHLTGIMSGKILFGRCIADDSKRRILPNAKKEYILGYDKNSLSIIQSTIDARNHEYLWVYTHPKVLYNSNYLQWELLRDSAKYLCCCYNNPQFEGEKLDFKKCVTCPHLQESDLASEEDFMMYILGFETFFDKQRENVFKVLEQKGYVFYRTCDDDLNALFKRVYRENKNRGILGSEKLDNDFEEFFARNHKKTLWKSFVEYDCFLNQHSDKARVLSGLCKSTVKESSIYKNNYSELQEEHKKIFQKYGLEDVVIIKAAAKTKQLNPYDTFINFKDYTLRLADIFGRELLKEKVTKDFYYIFARRTREIDYNDMEKLLGELADYV